MKAFPSWPLRVELYRNGRAPHWDPKKDRQRPEQLLWSIIVPMHSWPLSDPGEDVGDPRYPNGYHWRVLDSDGVLVAVAVNERFPMEVLVNNLPPDTTSVRPTIGDWSWNSIMALSERLDRLTNRCEELEMRRRILTKRVEALESWRED